MWIVVSLIAVASWVKKLGRKVALFQKATFGKFLPLHFSQTGDFLSQILYFWKKIFHLEEKFSTVKIAVGAGAFPFLS